MASHKLPAKPEPVIGFAYGTFDLLHDGHRHFLRHARSRCDYLIVALDSDRFARQRKGQGRPVEDEAQRSHNVVATGHASLVVAVDSLDQMFDAIRFYEPDFLFAGDDGLTRRPLGGRRPAVVPIPRLPGFSTTNAIKHRLQ